MHLPRPRSLRGTTWVNHLGHESCYLPSSGSGASGRCESLHSASAASQHLDCCWHSGRAQCFLLHNTAVTAAGTLGRARCSLVLAQHALALLSPRWRLPIHHSVKAFRVSRLEGVLGIGVVWFQGSRPNRSGPESPALTLTKYPIWPDLMKAV